MISRKLIFITVALCAAGGSFAATMAFRAKPAQASALDGVLEWLAVPTDQREQIKAHDPTFADDLKKLRADLNARRAELASVLTRSDVSDETIHNSSEATIAASNALERRVMGFLLSIRHHLTPEQQKRLFDLCAQSVKQGCASQCRRGAGRS